MSRTFDYKADLSILLILIIILIMAGGVYFTFAVIRSDPIEAALAGEDIISVLFAFEHEQKLLGSYVMMFSAMNNRAAVISVPGDTGKILKIEDRVGRLDSIYRSNSIEPFENEVRELLGLPISYSLVFETERLAKIIDLIGGVDIFIPNPMEVYGEEIILFPSGLTRLDGDKAVQYLVLEFPDEDRNEVILRRERFFLSLLRNLGEQNALFNRDSSVARHFYPLLKTRMNRLTQRKLFQALSLLDMDRINIQAVAGNYREMSGQKLLMPYYDGTVIRDVVRQAQRSLVQRPQGVLMERLFTVEILNGTARTGLAARTAELIRGFNYDVISAENADRNDYKKTEIIDRTGLENIANSFAAVIQCTNIRSEPRIPEEEELQIQQDTEYRADFTLIIGDDFNGRIVVEN